MNVSASSLLRPLKMRGSSTGGIQLCIRGMEVIAKQSEYLMCSWRRGSGEQIGRW